MELITEMWSKEVHQRFLSLFPRIRDVTGTCKSEIVVLDGFRWDPETTAQASTHSVPSTTMHSPFGKYI